MKPLQRPADTVQVMVLGLLHFGPVSVADIARRLDIGNDVAAAAVAALRRTGMLAQDGRNLCSLPGAPELYLPVRRRRTALRKARPEATADEAAELLVLDALKAHAAREDRQPRVTDLAATLQVPEHVVAAAVHRLTEGGRLAPDAVTFPRLAPAPDVPAGDPLEPAVKVLWVGRA